MWAWIQSLDPIAQAGLFGAMGVALGKLVDVWIARITHEDSSESDNEFSALLEDLRSERRLRRDSEHESRHLADRLKLVELRAETAESECARIRLDRQQRLLKRRRAIFRLKWIAKRLRDVNRSLALQMSDRERRIALLVADCEECRAALERERKRPRTGPLP